MENKKIQKPDFDNTCGF